MAIVKPMLDDLELQQVQSIEVDDDQVWAQHAVPALEGDFFQGLGRRASRVTLVGVLTGAEVDEGLENLRHKFRAAAPVSFVADIATATRIDQMLIEEMGVRELAGKPARFEYAFTLREYSPATPTEIVIPPPPPLPPEPRVETSVLEVEVQVAGEPDFDHSQTRVRVQGLDNDGNSIDRELSEREGNLWTADPFPSGNYTAQATTAAPVMTGVSNPVRLLLGERQRAIIELRPGQVIAHAFIIHYWFDKAFVEPCMRHVLRRVAQYAQDHPDRKLVIVGHTDESGSDQYNQSLSERRSRGAYAYLTFGRSPADADAAMAEWDELRKTRTVGVIRTINDTWGVRQYQSMLQDLGFYTGPIGDAHTPATDQAVRDFQAANGLDVDGIMGNQSWPVLIRAYMAQDSLAVPEVQFIPNARAANGCDQGVVQWLGCGEKMPVDSTPRGGCGDPAWRPNRRTDLLFVNDDTFPCDDIPEPVTISIRTSDQNPTGWCLGTNQGPGPQSPCCFLTFEASEQDKWLVQPAEPGTFVVNGRIQFENGTPLANTPYVLIAPDGEFMDGEVVCQHATQRKGTPILGQTDADGRFAYPGKPKGPGIYTLEIQADVVARTRGRPISEARGPVVCQRLDASDEFVVIVVSHAVVAIRPSITLGSPVVVVKKPHTNPQRQAVTLSVNQAFTGSGTFTRSNDAVRFFDAAVSGNEITFNGMDNVFTDAQLAAGHTVFAEGARASTAMNDVELRLALNVSSTPGLAATAFITSVELTLEVALSRVSPTSDPPLLPEADKVSIGRFVQTPEPGLSHERAMLIVHRVQPTAFTGDVVLARISDRVELFADETPAAAQVPLVDPQVIASAGIPAAGVKFFVQGRAASVSAQDTGYRLGLNGVESDGDNASMTVVQFDMAEQADIAAPPLTFTRFGLWDRAYDAAGNLINDAPEANNFIGRDIRRMHFRIRNAGVTANHLIIDWRTLEADRTTNVDAPASQQLVLPETATGSGIFISRGVMLVTDDTDANQRTHSGLAAPLPSPGIQLRGATNHRLRRAQMDGFVHGKLSPQAGVRLTITLPVFDRNPEERRRLQVRVIRYTDPSFVAATDPYIAAQFQHANDRWNQIGIQVDAAATIDRAVPAAALTGTEYAGSLDNPNEVAALADLIPITPDNTVTAVFVPLSGANAYATIAERTLSVLGNRYFIFIDEDLDLNDETLAHELAHVLFNRFDDATGRQFFTLNTNPPSALVIGTGIVLPDVRIYRRIQNLNSPDPNADPANDNIINWARRVRVGRFPIGTPGLSAATATTGNTLLQPF
jgi:outer membrane protein OmpA-like peptidoglycan-associated protein